MLAGLTLAAAVVHVGTVSAPIILRCYVNENVGENQFVLSIDREKHLMTVSSKLFNPTTIPILITPTLIKGRGPIHYNMTIFEITIPQLQVRRTLTPHIWPGPTPTLVSDGRCLGDIK